MDSPVDFDVWGLDNPNIFTVMPHACIYSIVNGIWVLQEIYKQAHNGCKKEDLETDPQEHLKILSFFHAFHEVCWFQLQRIVWCPDDKQFAIRSCKKQVVQSHDVRYW